MNEQKMHEAFEAWYGDIYSRYALRSWNGGTYENQDTELAWQSWQAATAATQRDAMAVAEAVESAFRRQCIKMNIQPLPAVDLAAIVAALPPAQTAPDATLVVAADNALRHIAGQYDIATGLPAMSATVAACGLASALARYKTAEGAGDDHHLVQQIEASELCAPASQQEPVAWIAFADSNGPVPLELYGLDEKACKYAVLMSARSAGWKGTIDGYLLHMGWSIRPLYPAPPAVAAPSEDGLQLDKGEVEFLAARVRRLCAKFNYPAPDKDDGLIVGVAGSLIGSILTNLELAERNKKTAAAVPEGWREFINDVAQQEPEKPDYWSSCGQCARNIDRAEDLLAATSKSGALADHSEDVLNMVEPAAAPKPEGGE